MILSSKKKQLSLQPNTPSLSTTPPLNKCHITNTWAPGLMNNSNSAPISITAKSNPGLSLPQQILLYPLRQCPASSLCWTMVTLYHNTPKTLLSKWNTLYRSVIRFSTGAPYCTHHCSLYEQFGQPSPLSMSSYSLHLPVCSNILLQLRLQSINTAATDWNKVQQDLKLNQFISIPSFMNRLNELVIHPGTASRVSGY